MTDFRKLLPYIRPHLRLLVLALVDRWTGWPQDVLGWAAGHLRDLIPDSVE